MRGRLSHPQSPPSPILVKQALEGALGIEALRATTVPLFCNKLAVMGRPARESCELIRSSWKARHWLKRT